MKPWLRTAGVASVCQSKGRDANCTDTESYAESTSIVAQKFTCITLNSNGWSRMRGATGDHPECIEAG